MEIVKELFAEHRKQKWSVTDTEARSKIKPVKAAGSDGIHPEVNKVVGERKPELLEKPLTK